MSTTERCENCKFWDDPHDGIGACRRFPLQYAYDPAIEEGIYHPLYTTFDNWCGEWKAKEQKENEN